MAEMHVNQNLAIQVSVLRLPITRTCPLESRMSLKLTSERRFTVGRFGVITEDRLCGSRVVLLRWADRRFGGKRRRGLLFRAIAGYGSHGL